MKFQLSQGTYMRLLGLLFLIICFGSCFSLGYSWSSLNPGDKLVKFTFVLMYFLGFWFFFNLGKTLQASEFKMPTETEADEIIKSFEAKGKKKVTTQKSAHKSVHK